MNVHLYSLCYNEIKILPFVIDYWKKIKESSEYFKAVVYDNGSNDGSLEFLSKFGFIETRHFDSEGLDDLKNIEIKNNAWKESIGKADFVIVCDMDECLYSPNLNEELCKMKEGSFSICSPVWYNTVSDKPIPEYKSGKLYHQLRDTCSKGNSKCVLFDPSKISEINYTPGAHFCYPSGDVKHYNTDNIFVLHLNDLNLEYKFWKFEERRKRLSTVNKQHDFGIHYSFPEERVVSDFESSLSEAVHFDK